MTSTQDHRTVLITWDSTRGKYGVKRDNAMFFDGWISGASDYRDAVESLISKGLLIKPEMFFDGKTGLVKLRILDTQWTMTAQDLMSRLNRFKDDHALMPDILASSEEALLSMRIVMAHGTKSVKP